MDYSTRKSAKHGVYLLLGLFNDENGLVCPSGLIGSITKVLTDVHQKIWQKMTSKIWITKRSMDYSEGN
ncbi:hypothetical protein H5410_056426 [Solanum commersonii]|uniref:Uncharacterized protein n=1 Tax=Solanum commersonii TaxID=4109 RepID=A0A9J5WM79_SOLCO|nr:hypothetical protein H5410_056426 [Solanum commersonii]